MSKVNRVKITQRMVSSLKPVDKETWIMDSEVRGLGLRQRPNAKPTWTLRYKDPATGRDLKLALYDALTVSVEYARSIAKQKQGELVSTGKIASERLEARLRVTVDEWVEEVAGTLAAKGRADSYVRDFRQQCRDYVVPFIGRTLVRDVQSGDVDRILTKIARRTALHNRVRSNLSALFTASRRAGLRTDNPVDGAAKTNEQPRTRLLDDEEMDRLLRALGANPCLEADAVRLLYLTGSRPKELFSAKWEDLKLPEDPTQPSVWTKPAQTVKQRRNQVVELSELAAATLRRMREEQGEKAKEQGAFVFPSRKVEGKHIWDVDAYWAKVRAEAKLTDARVYDLRKVFATRILAAGVDTKTAMSLTGHTQVGVFLKHYAQLAKGAQGDALRRVNWG